LSCQLLLLCFCCFELFLCNWQLLCGSLKPLLQLHALLLLQLQLLFSLLQLLLSI
jgi:hypothetical protein